MNRTKTRAPAARRHKDPELAGLLDFEPVERKVKRPDGWSPELQREFIALLAETGSPRRAADAMGKQVSGIESLYKQAGAVSFRAAWDEAVAIGKGRAAGKSGARLAGRPPGGGQRGGGSSGGGWIEPDPEPEMDEDAKLELMERIAGKFLRKVVAERQARLTGEIAAADFYLRQITHLEVAFDLAAESAGVKNAWQALKQVQRGGHRLLDIADSPFTQYLDAKRRQFWAATGEPMRPPALREEYLQDHGTHRTEEGNTALGACTDPPPGVAQEDWAKMDYPAQKRTLQELYAAEAASQIEWEAAARREYEQRRARGAAADHPPDDRNGVS